MTSTIASAALAAATDAAGRQIPPVWPLAASVAVNPFLGQTGSTLPEVSARLARVAGLRPTLPRDWYLARFADGRITPADLAGALNAAPTLHRPASPEALLAAARMPRPAAQALPTVADLAAGIDGIDWPGVIADRFGAWAAGYFDEGQALWPAPRGAGTWTAWRAHASHDLGPEIAGLSGFAAFVAATPEDAGQAIARAVVRLGLSSEALDTYFHQLLLGLGGWSQLARYRLWQAELAGGTDITLRDLLAIRLTWEQALLARHPDALAAPWADICQGHAEALAPSPDDIVDGLLQSAFERATQRALADTLRAPARAAPKARPALQAAFCIDVRSEVFRRALESADPGIVTIGFAGFFGIATRHRQFASDVEELRLPVLLNPGLASVTGDAATVARDKDARHAARARRAWGRFRLAAVSSFAFVEAMGPVYAGKLVRDALGLRAMPAPDAEPPRFETDLLIGAQIDAAETVLRAMTLTRDFARIVLLAGHGGNAVNTPHASALHCGACGGYSGEVNARLLAQVLNRPEVRDGLASRGIAVPSDTLFLAALHDTTTDAVRLFDADAPVAAHQGDLAQLRRWLETAGQLARGERALRLPGATCAADVPGRARNWAEVRPEWALAGCAAFIAAPRALTSGCRFDGRAFLHDYDWRSDAERDFAVLELILTAPVVVASWISLQYYGSTVAPSLFGAGNKLLHNVVGGIGVVEGNGGVLRAGLPWQSVHDGDAEVHEPVRLSVCVRAPESAISDILARHDGVRALFDNGWLSLFTLDAGGQIAQRYAGDLTWEAPLHPNLAVAAG